MLYAARCFQTPLFLVILGFFAICAVASCIMCTSDVTAGPETLALLQIVAINTTNKTAEREVESVIKKGLSVRNEQLGTIGNTKSS
jgi:hypothetical protein